MTLRPPQRVQILNFKISFHKTAYILALSVPLTRPPDGFILIVTHLFVSQIKYRNMATLRNILYDDGNLCENGTVTGHCDEYDHC
jgi:hypothetical protein